jgi:hypothetical protein
MTSSIYLTGILCTRIKARKKAGILAITCCELADASCRGGDAADVIDDANAETRAPGPIGALMLRCRRLTLD